jgi:hypothetical protein
VIDAGIPAHPTVGIPVDRPGIAVGAAAEVSATEGGILPARNGSLDALAAQVPPALLADQIGLSLSGASSWTKAVGAARGEYAGIRTR